ncbi:hypothetical protein [Fredinandcohnia quinoae]|uniref:Uncharacterized protein n=1 Tax=Fredinandcohnia quinoae TaxID=2918902 RepID=A0AAW5DZD1_9BACI|nr:hypothetical protein [Fredinandcohnia sp. SECRCQ15]MCH1624380.1 hypothetical protein [Fredinandcohnia sp. SECRCQ15]
MKRYMSLILVILFMISNKAGASIEGYEIASKSKEDNITLFAKNENGFYHDFKIDFKGSIYSRPFWVNVTNPTYAPEIIYKDINKDEKNELIIILTKGYGTGLLWEEVHVFDTKNQAVNEVLVDNPIAIINKNVKTKISNEKAVLTISGKTTFVDIASLEINPSNLFEDIGFGSIIDYEVRDDQLIAKVIGQVSQAGFIGEIVITYDYRDKMYQAKSIEFQPYK